MHVLAIDVGGTKISGALVDRDFTLLFPETISSRKSIKGIADPTLAETKKLVQSLCLQAKTHGVSLSFGGVGFPEYVNLKGLLTTADNVGWTTQPQDDFATLTGFPWVAQSDVRCAGIAESHLGAGREIPDFVYVTISSGISHTHFLNGIAVTGEVGEAIGFGLTEIEILGQSHVLENYCSGLGIARRYAEVTQDFSMNAKDLIGKYETDAVATEIIVTASAVLGDQLAQLAHGLSTQVLVIGGGLWMGSQIYRACVLESFEKTCQMLKICPSIRNAEVQNSGVIGAAVYAFAELA